MLADQVITSSILLLGFSNIHPPKINGQKKQIGIPMECNYIVIEQLLFIGLQHLLRLRQLLMVRKCHILILNASSVHFNCYSYISVDVRKLDQLLQKMLRILRGQEQIIKVTQVDIKNTLAVVMHNTIPAEPELGGIKEELCLPVRSLALFDIMNITIRKDKIRRMKLVDC